MDELHTYCLLLLVITSDFLQLSSMQRSERKCLKSKRKEAYLKALRQLTDRYHNTRGAVDGLNASTSLRYYDMIQNQGFGEGTMRMPGSLATVGVGTWQCACLPGSSNFSTRSLHSSFYSRLLFPARLLNRGSWDSSRNSICRGLLFKAALNSTGIRAFTDVTSGQTENTEKPAETSERPSKAYVWPDIKSPRICILGGGFAGLNTALRLESLVWPPDKRPQILLVDQSERFVFKPMLYELLSKEVDVWEIAPLFSDLLANTSVRFLHDTVQSVSPFDAAGGNGKPAASMGGRVYLGSGIQVDYDWLVLALGAESKTDIVAGASEYALPFSSLEDALEVDKRLQKLERDRFGPDQPPISVAVVGSGYCGIELSATIAERLGERGRVQVIDVNSEICPSAPAGNRESALNVLSSQNVKLELGYFVTSIGPVDSSETGKQNRLVLELKPATRNSRRSPASSFLEVDLVLWTVGSRAVLPAGESKSTFPINGRGQADTDETLRVKGHPRIFAIGDSAGIKDSSGRVLPTTAQVAFQQADYAGWNVWAAINDRPLLPFKYQHLGEMMTLGRYNGAVSASFIEDLTLDGVLGHTARRLAYLYRLPTNEHRLKVGVSWLTKSAVDTFSYVQDTVAKLASPTT